MKLSRKFLNRYLNIDNIKSTDLANEMMLIGNEYESIKTIATGTNLVIGEVLSVTKHPDSDHLNICQVKVSETDTYQIVCGAPNVRSNIKVIVSLPGAILPGDFVIKKSVIRGVESNGMICALGEIGVESKYLSEEDKTGIHILANDAKVGTDPLEYLMFNDEVIDFELTANRGDLLSIIGMAHEVGAIYNQKPILKDNNPMNEIEDINNYLKVEVLTDKAPLYLARMVKDAVIKESPQFIKSALMASGIRPINNIVDISNYVMLEYGQPLHFFDYDKLSKEIIVRQAKENEETVTLDNETRTLTESDIVITSNDQVVALAGVMGGLNSEITQTTKNIIIESAIFNSISIRNTAKRILKSESSMRFEKGIDKNRTYAAINRAVYLLEKYADAKVIKSQITHDNYQQPTHKIEISLEFINKILGIVVTNEEVLDILNRLSFEVNVLEDNKYLVTVPSHRLDVTIKEDLVEEIARINGTDKLVGKLPKLSVKPGSYDSKYQYEHIISNKLLSLGLNETRTYTLSNKKEALLFNEEENLFKISNPMTEEREYLRQSIIPSLINVANYNSARKQDNLTFFEISNVYLNKDTEATKLAMLVSGTHDINTWNKELIKRDFYYLKGIVESLFEYLGLSNRYEFKTDRYLKDFHPYQSATIYLDRQEIGKIGTIHPSISKNKLYAAEIDINSLFNTKIKSLKAKEISKYPEVSKDFAFLVKKEVSANDLLATIKNSAREITNVKLFDIYEGTNIDNELKSLAFNVSIQSLTKTLTEEEINSIYNRIIENVLKKYEATFRDK